MGTTIGTTETTDRTVEINMGYGGFCGIDWKTDSLVKQDHATVKAIPTLTTIQQVFITSGNIALNYTRPQLNSYRAPRDTTSAVPILLSPGTAQISGSVSFDMSHDNLTYFLDQAKLSRNTYFHLIMSDGGDYYAVYHCMWNSFSISASSGGLVTCSVGYIALNCFSDNVVPSTTLIGINLTNVFDNALVAYWEAGTNGYVLSFSINLTQDVTPVYLNNDLIMPTYLRSGSLKLNASIESCVSWENISSVVNLSNWTANSNSLVSSTTTPKFSFQIGSKNFQFENALLSSKEYNHAGAGDVVKYSYSILSVSMTSPQGSLFTISGSSL